MWLGLPQYVHLNADTLYIKYTSPISTCLKVIIVPCIRVSLDLENYFLREERARNKE